MSERLPLVTIRFASSVDVKSVSAHDRAVLESLLLASGNTSALVTSGTRTPEHQARVMYANLVLHGVAEQRKLYLAAGDSVIDTYEQHYTEPSVACITAMASRIREVGPSRVSHHCADPSKLGVYDIALTSLARPGPFIEACSQQLRPGGTLSKFLTPAQHDPAFHLEIPQPGVA